MAEQAYEDHVQGLREACAAHLCAAGRLLGASVALVHAAGTRSEDDYSLMARLGEIRPADDEQSTSGILSDKEFLLDRAASYRNKAEVMNSNGLKLFGALAELVEGHVSQDAELGFAEELQRRLVPYLEAVDRGCEEITAVAAGIRTAFGEDALWEDSLQEFAGAQLFLSEESALFAALLETE